MNTYPQQCLETENFQEKLSSIKNIQHFRENYQHRNTKALYYS